ncbi:CAP domain-containing protein [Nonomuraea sp. M3C6]|uniref:CAP domain-containing protein n=1 Tax=Nonomuraea marmarensis TaxID=3351344 RepID=A0ABW7AQP1_9ACTN
MTSNRARLTITATAAVAASILTLAAAPLSAAANASTTAAAECGTAAQYYDKVPVSGTGSLAKQYNFRLSQAVHCLIDAERAKAGLPPLTRVGKLDAASADHARAAVSLKWWKPGADSHRNPQTGSTPSSRIRGADYCPNPRSWAVAETTYNGWGGAGTPRAAVHWWVYVSKAGHREIILSKSLTDVGTLGVVAGAADPAGAGASKAGTYVATFGRCRQ